MSAEEHERDDEEEAAEVEPTRFAIATSRDPNLVMPRLQAACEALTDRIERQVTGHLMIDYEELERGAMQHDFPLMWLPPLVAARLIVADVARPLAIPVRNEQTEYATAIFTRPDGGLEALDDVKGKTMGWVDPKSAAGYVLPRALLAARGIDPDAELGEQRYLHSHDAAVKAALDGEVDAAATYVRLDDGEIVDAAWGERDVRLLATYGPIPADLIAYGRLLELASHDAIAADLLEHADSEVAERCRELLECEAFAKPTPEHLRALITLGKHDAESS